MEKLNIAEILKDCPKGMELDCTMFKDVYFDCVEQENGIIKCYIQNNDHKISISFTKYGYYTGHEKSKCVIFPEGKTTWEGFQRPFRDGDVVVDTLGGIHIMRNASTSYCYFDRLGILDKTETSCVRVDHLATEEEKQKLFKAIKDNGYKWNDGTKTLEKLIEPKFKVGNRVKKNKDYISGIVTDIFEDSFKVTYDSGGCSYVQFHSQCDWELVPNKFDITTFKPFESRVLVRGSNDDIWKPAIWGIYNDIYCSAYPYITTYGATRQCIPYEDNQHLLGTTNDCDDYFKTWE